MWTYRETRLSGGWVSSINWNAEENDSFFCSVMIYNFFYDYVLCCVEYIFCCFNVCCWVAYLLIQHWFWFWYFLCTLIYNILFIWSFIYFCRCEDLTRTNYSGMNPKIPADDCGNWHWNRIDDDGSCKKKLRKDGKQRCIQFMMSN